jgi:glucokinase
MLLAGDIGGTKTSLAIYGREAGPRVALAEATFPSARYASLEDIVVEFLLRSGLTVEHASFGVAGPVVEGRASITNLPWTIDVADMADSLRISSVCLLNDLAAIANAVPYLTTEDYDTVVPGQAVKGGAIAVIAPGTGLGEAFLTWDGTRYRAHPSEGGHADFAPVNPREVQLLCYLLERFDHISYERVCSGKGIPNIYNFLKDSGYAEEPAWLAEELASTDDPTRVIVRCASDPGKASVLCSATLEAFALILGTEAGNLTLKLLATGGVYLGGGIPPRILPMLKTGQFERAFRSKGRLSELMDQIPVHVILNTKVALLGAAYYGFECVYGATHHPLETVPLGDGLPIAPDQRRDSPPGP